MKLKLIRKILSIFTCVTIAVSPLIHQDTNIVLRNGNTAYFGKPSVGVPFMLNAGQNFDFTVGCKEYSKYCEVGIMDEADNVIDRAFFGTQSYGFGLTTKIPKDGKYRCYVTNYGVDDVTLTYARFE